MGYLIRPQQRILIASRYFARRGFFDRSIKDYISGFSDGRSNFWIGLSVLHRVTNKHSYNLRIEILNGSRIIMEEYGLFQVASEALKFKLKVGHLISGVNGFFELHKNAEFSTFDFGAQRYQAVRYAGGFWHRAYNYDYSNTGDNYYCFSCEDRVDPLGTSFNNTLSHASVRTYVTRMYLIA